MPNHKRLHHTTFDATFDAAIRLAGGAALVFALLASPAASAGRFTEHDASGPAFQGPMAGTPAAGPGRQEAKAETVLSDAGDGAVETRGEREAGTTRPSPFLRTFGTR